MVRDVFLLFANGRSQDPLSPVFKLKNIIAFLSFLLLPILSTAPSWFWYLLLQDEGLVQTQWSALGPLRHLRYPASS